MIVHMWGYTSWWKWYAESSMFGLAAPPSQDASDV